MNVNVIERMVASAEQIPSTKIKRLSEELEVLDTQAKNMEKLYDSLFGVEKTKEIKKELNSLRKRQSWLEFSLKKNYRLLSLEPLRWRDEEGWPKLVVFSLDSPIFKLFSKVVNLHWEYEIHPSLPDPIASCYTDVLNRLEGLGRRYHSWVSYHYTCYFNGLIPAHVRQKILEAKANKLFQDVLIIADAATCHSEVVPEISPDPLAVGFDYHERLWLIAHFDTTTIEQAMVFSFPDASTSKN